MNAFRLITLASVLALLQACSSLPGQQADINAVITASGLDAQLKLLQQPLNSEKMDGPLALIPDKWIHTVNTVIAESVKPEQIRANLHSELGKKLSRAELADVQKFYESGTGQRVVALESGRAEKTYSTGNHPDNAALDALANATGAGKAVSQLAQHGLNDAIDVAVKNGCFGLDQIPFASMVVGVLKKSQLSALRQTVNTGIRQQYAQLSPTEQASYLAFAQSTAGQKFFAARTSVMSDTATRAGDALSGQLGLHILKICSGAKA